MRIRAEFTMYNALSVAFLAVAIMAALADALPWAIANLLAAPLIAYRGGKVEETYIKTVTRFFDDYAKTAPGDGLHAPHTPKAN